MAGKVVDDGHSGGKKMKTWIRNNWTDPVWSKVFAGIILFFLGGIGTILVSLFNQIPIDELYKNSISTYLRVNYFTISLFLIILFSLLIPAFLFDIIKIQFNPLYVSKRNIKTIFPGKWLNEYEFNNGQKGQETFEIRNSNEYYINGIHMFNIDSFVIDKNTKMIKFMKNGIGTDTRKAFNTLKKINDRRYEGIEVDGTKITYSRLE